jgi:hypothetical protein
MLGQIAAFDNRRSRIRKTVKIFQRFEVWLLLFLAAGAMAWVFLSSAPEAGRPASDGPAAGGAAEVPMVLHRLSLERDHANARLDIDVRLINKHAKRLQLVQPVMKLVGGRGHLVPEFFLPVEPPPEIGAKATAEVHLRYWLEKTDLAGPLTLTFEDQSLDLKSARPLDFEKLKNGQAKTFGAGDWEVR